MDLKISDAAAAAGVSIRTLRHYDQIGLLSPSRKQENGYRLYTTEDLEKLQQIMFFRELDFSLSDISKIIGNPEIDKMNIFKQQHEFLLIKKKRLNNIIASLERTISSIEEGKTMKNSERFDAFSMEKIEEHKRRYAEETEKKYGKSDAWKESNAKTSKYSEQDWKKVMDDGTDILRNMADLMDRSPSDEAVMDTVRQWQDHITNNFYTCTDEILSGLAEMYTADERFTENIDRIKPGLAAFLSTAIGYYCRNKF